MKKMPVLLLLLFLPLFISRGERDESVPTNVTAAALRGQFIARSGPVLGQEGEDYIFTNQSRDFLPLASRKQNRACGQQTCFIEPKKKFQLPCQHFKTRSNCAFVEPEAFIIQHFSRSFLLNFSSSLSFFRATLPSANWKPTSSWSSWERVPMPPSLRVTASKKRTQPNIKPALIPIFLYLA